MAIRQNYLKKKVQNLEYFLEKRQNMGYFEKIFNR